MSHRARALAEAFDRSFQQPARVEADAGSQALAIRVAGDPYLLPLEGLSSVSRAPKIVPLPSSPAVQLGIAGIRGAVVGVFSLAALLGYDVTHARTSWLVVTAGPKPIAFGVERIDRQVLVPARCIVGDARAPSSRRHVVSLILLEDESAHRGLLDVDSLLRGIAAAGAPR